MDLKNIYNFLKNKKSPCAKRQYFATNNNEIFSRSGHNVFVSKFLGNNIDGSLKFPLDIKTTLNLRKS